jgi:hypothetical protein
VLGEIPFETFAHVFDHWMESLEWVSQNIGGYYPQVKDSLISFFSFQIRDRDIRPEWNTRDNTDTLDTASAIDNRPHAFRMYPSSRVQADGDLIDRNNVWTMLDFAIFLNNLPGTVIPADCSRCSRSIQTFVFVPKDEPQTTTIKLARLNPIKFIVVRPGNCAHVSVSPA